MARRSGNRGEDRAPKRISKSIVDDEPLPAKGCRTMIWDSDIKGFGVRITPAGVKTYLLRYRMGERGTPIRTLTIGQHGSPWTPEQARKRAAELLLQVRSGRDLVAEREREAERTLAEAGDREKRMFAVMAEDWFRKHVEREGLRSHRDIRGVLDRDLKPAFADKTIEEITKKDVTDALDSIGDRSGSAPNKAHKWARQIFNWLKDERGEIKQSPIDGVKRPYPEPSRTRVLSLPELVVLWVALEGLSDPFRTSTGCSYCWASDCARRPTRHGANSTSSPATGSFRGRVPRPTATTSCPCPSRRSNCSRTSSPIPASAEDTCSPPTAGPA